jgi:hypothetical protein
VITIPRDLEPWPPLQTSLRFSRLLSILTRTSESLQNSTSPNSSRILVSPGFLPFLCATHTSNRVGALTCTARALSRRRFILLSTTDEFSCKCSKAPYLDDFFFSSLGLLLALCDYRAPKIRKGTLVSIFPTIQRRCAATRGSFFLFFFNVSSIAEILLLLF